LKKNHIFDLNGLKTYKNLGQMSLISSSSSSSSSINLKNNIITIKEKPYILFKGIKNYKNLGHTSLILL
jgi:hypothetical protein